MYDGQCTREGLSHALAQVGSRCRIDDFFLYYYAGHGCQIQDLDGDEDDEKDECLVLASSSGQSYQTEPMLDDEFGELVCHSIPRGVRLLIITDCPHSASICDFNHNCWEGR